MIIDAIVRSGRIPDGLLRFGIRRSCAHRLRLERARDLAELERTAADLSAGPIAIETAAANRQHYRLPAAFFDLVLGPRRKYSGCYWPDGATTLPQAEDAMLQLTCDRAGIEDGMEILDLGCGWGSLSGWIAEHYPNCRVLAVSNSLEQKAYIDSLALSAVDVVTADVNTFATERRFDRVLSIEMFEHMHNWSALLDKISALLRPDGRLFVHVFAHVHHAYAFERSWMARHFFSGGIMPSDDLVFRFPHRLVVEEHWRIDGTHYERTANAWLANLDVRRDQAQAILGSAAAVNEWRAFFMACAELFGYARGREWIVSHYLLGPR